MHLKRCMFVRSLIDILPQWNSTLICMDEVILMIALRDARLFLGGGMLS